MSTITEPTTPAGVDDIPRATKAAILRALASYTRPKLEAPNLAHRYGLTIDLVNELATRHGGIEQPARLRKAAEILERGGEPPAPAAAAASTSTVTTAAPVPGDLLTALIERGKNAKRAGTRTKAARLETLVRDLEAALDAEAEQARKAAAAKAEREKAAAEVKKLQEQLRAARAKLGKTPKPATTAGADPKTVRAWARENGVDCPTSGRLPGNVIDAYQAAQNG
jgi:hypothetical protein